MANTSTLTVTLPSDREIVLTRDFDAPRDLVFEAFTSCQHMAHWWGQAGSTLVTCDMDFRPGGSWRYVERDSKGDEWGFRGEYRAITRPEQIVWTFEFEGMPGHVSEETMIFEDLGGRTRIVGTSVFSSQEDRDGMIQSGMEKGATEAYDRLAEYLRTLARR
ncbi:MAG TPA: SRPBCC family protein [Chloroflexota bacterium]